ncbi:MAG: hypothetical protein K0S29_788 [Gammaproteobacteria bacterium]|nr:hypothetical protein [Gammaproteobacteria bacterium]
MPCGDGPAYPIVDTGQGITPATIFNTTINGIAQACNMTIALFNQSTSCNFSAFSNQYDYSQIGGASGQWWNTEFDVAAGGPCNASTAFNGTCFYNQLVAAQNASVALYPTPSPEPHARGLIGPSAGEIAGIVIGALAGIGGAIYCWHKCRNRNAQSGADQYENLRAQPDVA